MKRNENQWIDEDQRFDEELSKTLTAAVSSRQESGFSSPEEFEAWLRQGDEKRSQRQRRRLQWGLTAAAAVFVCAFFLYNVFFASAAILPASVLMPWNPSETYAAPDSQSDPTITEENGSIVIGGDGNMNMGEWSATFASYEEIPEKYQDETSWLKNLPEDCEVAQIEISVKFEKIFFSSLISVNKDDFLYIKQELSQKNEVPVIIVNQYDNTTIVDNMKIYIKQEKNCNLYVFVQGTSLITIQDMKTLDTKKIEAIITSIKTDLNRQ